jgi:HSP20 family protein
MNETKEKTSKLIYAFLGVLLLLVLAQSWFMFDMYKKLDAVQPDSSAVIGQAKQNNEPANKRPSKQVAQAPNSSALNDNGYNEPFNADDWDPYKEMQQMQDHMNQIFGQAFSRFDRSPDFRHLFDSSRISPTFDMVETDQNFVIKMDLPGVDEQNIDIHIEGLILTISGRIEQDDKTTDDEGQVIRRERRNEQFSRTITLAAPVNAEAMTSQVDNGVLTIKLPKA